MTSRKPGPNGSGRRTRRCIRNGSWHRLISRRKSTTSRRLTYRGPFRSEKATRSASCEAASAGRKERSSPWIASMGPSSSKGSRSRRWMRRKWPGPCTPRISSSSGWTTRIRGGGASSRSESIVKKHLKRLPAPRSWTIPRKTDFWVVKPSPGPHPIDASVPIGLILRDMLKVCATAREARHILNDRGVLVDGRPITDPKFPVGLMDVLSFAVTKAHYRMLVNTRGKMALVPIEEADANWKLCRVEDKTTVRRGKTQLNLHDGRNVLLEKDAYKTGATLKVHVPDQKVVELVTKQKSVQTLSHQAVRDWGVRRNMPIGTRVTLRGGPAEAFLTEALSIRNNRLPGYSFDTRGNFSFGIQDYTDFQGMKYDPEIGVFGMDVSVSLQRPGWRVARRSNKSRRIPRRHRVTRDEGMQFMKDRFKVEVVV